MIKSHMSQRQRGEPTLPLINIVFLMLIFFLVAAQLARPLDGDLRLVQTDDPALVPPPDALVLMADGTIQFRGLTMTPADAYAQLLSEGVGGASVPVRVLPDRRSDAQTLMAVARALRAAGASAVYVMTERAL